MQAPNQPVLRLAALGDLHCTVRSRGRMRELFAQMARDADVVALCGDLTDVGHPDEAHVLAEELAGAGTTPVVAVLGNHDCESGQEADIKRILTAAGVRVLDGDAVEIGGVGFAGTKGFIGGFGRFTLQSWGEEATKRIVRDAMDEAVKLESALAKIRASRRVVLLHYSPIHETVEGEPPEIIPFLGSSRLEEPLRRHPVDLVLHGHAHHGSPEGRAADGIVVYNVAQPLLERLGLPFRLIPLPVGVTHAAP